MIDAGVHLLSAAEYFADPCPSPSLSATGIGLLDRYRPVHLADAHPRLSPASILGDEVPQSAAQRLGTLVHALVLGRGREIDVVRGYSDWKKQGAQLRRRAALAAGRFPALEEEVDRAQAIATRAVDQLEQKFDRWPIGESEVTVTWQRSTASGPIWCRAMLDHLAVPADRRSPLILDVKVLTHAASNEGFANRIASDDDDLQAAWYLEGVATVCGGAPRFLWVVIEAETSVNTRFLRPSPRWLAAASVRVDAAAETFARCLSEQEFPGWPSEELDIEMPDWRARHWAPTSPTQGGDISLVLDLQNSSPTLLGGVSPSAAVADLQEVHDV